MAALPPRLGDEEPGTVHFAGRRSLRYRYLTNRATSLGCITHALGGLEDHIHIVASIPPKLAITEYVRDLKGASAHHMSHDLSVPLLHFSWQRGYGVFSPGGKQLPDAVAYVKNQKRHHEQGTIIPALETDHAKEDAPRPVQRETH
ncbi:MAG TPA: transposase [Dehalococcoidia bacterium]|nr:transposase [Dehalococcoidia bacterium]